MNGRITWKVYAALALAVLLFVSTMPFVGHGQAALTAKNCYSTQFHAATDCDRLASLHSSIAVTGERSAPSLNECYSTRFHAASDCDRIAGEIVGH